MKIAPAILMLIAGAASADETSQFEFRRPHPLPTQCVYKSAGQAVDLHAAKSISFAALRKEQGRVITRVTFAPFDSGKPVVVVMVPDVDAELARIQTALKACK